MEEAILGIAKKFNSSTVAVAFLTKCRNTIFRANVPMIRKKCI